jgi:cytidylate kinase
MLANLLGYQFIDSGSIYRAGCFFLLSRGLPVDNDLYAANVLGNLNLSFELRDGNYGVNLDGVDITPHLETPEVTELVPIVGGRPEVRRIVKGIQHRLVSAKDTVITGRDVGTEIFPFAPIKFFLTASPEVRASRRFSQLREKGWGSYEDILESIRRRDYLDSSREVSPSREPKDAIRIDTDLLNIDSVRDLIYIRTLEQLAELHSPEGSYPSSREML